MSARAIWKGCLKVGSRTIPVKLYSALTDRDVHFHMLEQRTRARIKQHMVHPQTGEEVATADVQKALEVEPGTFVVLREEELAKLEPEDSRDIEILHFLPPEQINHQWYERPYYLGPDGDTEAYFAFAEALAEQKKEGLVQWVMRDRQYFGALCAEGDYLVLITLRNAEEVLLPRELPAGPRRVTTEGELKMAEELISLLEGEFRPEEFRDEYRDRVLQFLEARAKGKRPKLQRVKTRATGKPLESALARSIAAVKRKKEKAVA